MDLEESKKIDMITRSFAKIDPRYFSQAETEEDLVRAVNPSMDILQFSPQTSK